MKNCCTNTTIIPSQCSACEEFTDSLCVIDSSGLSCLNVPEDTPQGLINQIFAAAICDLSGGDASACCPEWADITNYAASGEYEWGPAPSGEIGVVQVPQYTIPSACNCNTVKLRGVVVGNWTDDTMLMFTLPLGISPINIRVYSTVVQVATEKFYFPALILVNGNQVSLLLDRASCCRSDEFAIGSTLIVTLEGIQFETSV